MNLPDGCSDKDIDKRFGEEILNDDSSGLCEGCDARFLWEDLVRVDDGIYLCGRCSEGHNE